MLQAKERLQATKFVYKVKDPFKATDGNQKVLAYAKRFAKEKTELMERLRNV